jgi:hypothetical protein
VRRVGGELTPARRALGQSVHMSHQMSYQPPWWG